ncbi:MAG: hypothetical protein AAGI27_13425 [Pseudomonadota bacterium]
MTLRILPLLVAVMPFIGVTIAYWIASANTLVPSCMPLIDGCTSISATGRYEPASWVFRAVQLPLASLLFVTWLLSVQWLKGMHHDGRAAHWTILIAGTVGAVALIVYVTFLGTREPFYEFMRRFGIYFYFVGTAVAQLTLAIAVARIEPKSARFEGGMQSTALIGLATLPWLLGVLNLLLKQLLDDADAMENRIEWIAALSMQLYWLFLWLAWRATGFEAAVRTDVLPPR